MTRQQTINEIKGMIRRNPTWPKRKATRRMLILMIRRARDPIGFENDYAGFKRL
jgi:hypothetical protein